MDAKSIVPDCINDKAGVSTADDVVDHGEGLSAEFHVVAA